MTRPIVSVICALSLFACAPKPADAPATPAAATPPPARDLKPVAAALIHAGMIADGDRLVISGTAKDAALLEDIAIEGMKVGADPVITIGSESLTRRSYDEVPASYDTKTSKLAVGLVGMTDAQISVDYGANDTLMKGIAPERVAARAKSAEPVNQAFFKHPGKSVNLGNGLYPSAALAAALGKSESELTDIFWNSVAVPADTLRATAMKIETPLKASKAVQITSPNGTDIKFSVDGAKGFISDGVLTADKLKQGAAAAATYLPAGEVLVPVTAGTGNGTIVVDKVRMGGLVIEGLSLTFANGKLTKSEAKVNYDEFKKRLDLAGNGKDIFSWLDLGANPAVNLPTNSGRIVWMAAGGITIGMGDNRGWGGSNASDFTFTGALTTPTLIVDGKTVVKDGKLQ